METCKHCGNKLDSMGICKNCHLPYEEAISQTSCSNCGALIPGGKSFCLVCKHSLNDVSTSGEIKAAPEFSPRILTYDLSEEYHTKITGTLKILSLLILTGITGVLIWMFLPRFMPVRLPDTAKSVAYIADNNLYLKSDGFDSILLDRGYAPDTIDAVKANSDKDKLLLIKPNKVNKSIGDLYLLDIKALVTAQNADTLIAKDVKEFGFFKNSSDIYYIDKEGSLYIYKGRQTVLYETDVHEFIDAGDKSFLYLCRFKENALYMGFKNTDASKILIDAEVLNIEDYSPDFSKVMYTKASEDKKDLFIFDYKSGAVKRLAAGISEIVNASAKNSTALYLNEHSYVPSYSDFIEDSHLKTDSEMKKPDPLEFGLPEDFDMEIPDSDTIREDPTFWESHEEYLLALKSYDEKLKRDEIRNSLRLKIATTDTKNIKNYAFYLVRDNSVQSLDESFYFINKNQSLGDVIKSDLEENYLVYIKSDIKNLPLKSIDDFKEKSSVLSFDPVAYIKANVSDKLLFTRLDKNFEMLYTTPPGVKISSAEIDTAYTGIYFITNSHEFDVSNGELYYISVTNPGEPFALEGGVWEVLGRENNFNGSMIYIKETGKNLCDIYTIKDGINKQAIAYEVSYLPKIKLENKGKAVLYYRRAVNSYSKSEGELYLYNNKERLLVSKVLENIYINDNLIYILRNNGTGGAELNVYDKNGLYKIADNVLEVKQVS